MIFKFNARTGDSSSSTGNSAFPQRSSISHWEVTSTVRAGLQGVRCWSSTSWVKLEKK